MSPFLFALVATFLAAMGGRDQRIAAQLSERLGGPVGLLAICWIIAIASAVLAAAIGAGMATIFLPDGKTMFVALALLLGAIELAWPFRRREPVEPTHSLFAIGFVLAVRQLLDAARFLLVALAAYFGEPVFVAAGGAIGGGAALTLGWAMGGGLERGLPLRAIRLGVAVLLLLGAIWAGLSARGIV
jgi:putative Ca2+/H+ antiporter (TMEM165/GDT1 family)